MQSNALNDIGFWSKNTRSKKEMQKGIFFSRTWRSILVTLWLQGKSAVE